MINQLVSNMPNLDQPDIRKAAALFIDSQGRLLLSKDKHSTKWQVLGGKIETGETPVQTIIREMHEELAVEVEVKQKQYASSSIFPAANDPGKTVQLYYYFCKLFGKPKMIENVEFVRWFSKSDVQSGQFEFAKSTEKFLLPKLIKDKILK
jgi:mutator protein MutT